MARCLALEAADLAIAVSGGLEATRERCHIYIADPRQAGLRELYWAQQSLNTTNACLVRLLFTTS